MLGAIIGDIVGSTREHHNIKREDFELVPEGSRFTDDTVMTLAVAEWLMADPDHKTETLVTIMQRLGRKYRHAGYGKKFKGWLDAESPRPYGSFGNGSAMRVSPVGLYASTLEEALHLARLTAMVSHNHPEGIKGAEAVAGAVFLSRQNDSDAPKQIERFIRSQIGYDLYMDLAEIRLTYRFDSSCMGSVPIAIKAYLDRAEESPERALRLSISMGGDSDTIGAITASIASAGEKKFSEKLVQQCRSLLPHGLLEINDRFEAFICKPYDKVNYNLNNKQTRTRDRIRGSLMAGAAGDALGFPVEFMSRNGILLRYGERGITQFDLTNGKALISDDTQMTLFTANGMLMGVTRGYMRGIGGVPENYVDVAYLDWYYTQTGRSTGRNAHHTWLRDLPEMAHRRAPGNTCLLACESLLNHEEVRNNSKGCGGIMRVAPMALFMAGYWSRGAHPYSQTQMDEAGAKIAAVTHKHPLGFLPAALLTHLIYKIIQLDEQDIRTHMKEMAEETADSLDTIFVGRYAKEKQVLKDLTRTAIQLAANDRSDMENIRALGEGWIGEEAWAIALYAAVRYVDSMEKAITTAVNHDGDSDSTGSICGHIMGAIYGYEEIKRQRLFCPKGREFEETLELSPIILALADDLFTSCPTSEYEQQLTKEKQQWLDRYCDMKPAGVKTDR